MRLMYLGLPLGLWVLRRNGYWPAIAGIGHPRAPGMSRIRTQTRDTLLLGKPDLEDPATVAAIVDEPPDAILCWFWPRRIPGALVRLAPCFGVHPSLLPDLRGPDPYFWAIRHGLGETGVTLHRLDEHYDTGPIVTRVRVPIHPDDTAGRLARRLDRPSLTLLIGAAATLSSGVVPEGEPQRAPGRWAPIPTASDLVLDWHQSAEVLARTVRAAAPSPGATALLGSTYVTVLASAAVGTTALALEPGEAELSSSGPIVRCGTDGLRLEHVVTDDGVVLRREAIGSLL